MNAETKICRNCKGQFVIEPEDFDFYKKIDVPPPTWCPACRLQRRLAWRNEWRLFKNKDSRTGKEIFTNFSPGAPVKIYERDYWLSDNWDPLSHGRDIDWSRPFLSQVKELIGEVPIFSRAVTSVTNSDYCMNAGWLKNAYLTFNSDYVEDSAYIFSCVYVNRSFDCELARRLELCYECLNVNACHKSFYCLDCESCQETILCKNCVSCMNCFGCANLKNKSYHIFNEPYTKTEYFKKLVEFKMDSYSGLGCAVRDAHSFWGKYPVKFAHVRHNSNATGEYVFHSKNVRDSYRVYDGAEDCRYCQLILLGPEKDCYDHTGWGKGTERAYEVLQVGDGTYNIKFSVGCYTQAKDVEYSLFCTGGRNLFGCVSAHHKQFCILNKRYTEAEYNKLVPKIREHMAEVPYVDKVGREYRYGEFFPPEFAPYSYNETIAQEYFPLAKEETVANGFTWREVEKNKYPIAITPDELPDCIADTAENVAGAVIGCAHGGSCAHECTGSFRVTNDELRFCKSMSIPLPRLCPYCRHWERIKLRNSFRLYHRKCACGCPPSEKVYTNVAPHYSHGGAPCPNEFETPYSPDRPEIVYCEQCYQAEVA